MPERAKITSIEALETFRASLVVYLERSRGILAQISDEVVHTRLWLQSDRRLHWANEVRRRTRDLERRQQELLSARLSMLVEATPEQRVAVEKAKRALAEAEAKLDRVNHWLRQYDSLVAPVEKEVDKLREVLDHDMEKAEVFLSQALQALAAYAETRVGAPRAEATAAEANRTETTPAPEGTPP